MSFLYNELPATRKRELDAHLRACGECQNAVGRWRGTMAGLQRWQLTELPGKRAAGRSNPVLRWALAASLVLGLGYALGRVTAPQPDLHALRTSLAVDVAQQLRQEFAGDWQAAVRGGPEQVNTEFRRQLRSGLEEWSGQTVALASDESERLFADFLATSKAERQQDRQLMLSLFDRAEAQSQTKYLSLRRALETVAVVAADQFERTETQIGELASLTQAKLLPD